MATVSYDSFYNFFMIKNGEASLSDLVSAKGSAIADTDVIYCATGTTKGILGIQDLESVECSWRIGFNRTGSFATESDSPGLVRIYAGGEIVAPASVYPLEDYFYFNPGYGELETVGTAPDDHATIDMNEHPNTALLGWSANVRHLDIINVKSGGTLDFSDVQGTHIGLTISGKNGASYNIIGVPEKGFFARGVDLGRAISGIFTDEALYDIDMVNDSFIVKCEPNRTANLSGVNVPGRPTGRIYPNGIKPGSYNLAIRIKSGEEETITRNLEILHTEDTPFLLVVRSHGSQADYPMDYLIRGRISQPLMPYPEGIDFRDLPLNIVEDA